MHFLIKLKENLNISYLKTFNDGTDHSNHPCFIKFYGNCIRSLEFEQTKFYILGDLVTNLSLSELPIALSKAVENNTVYKFGGFFYLISIDKNKIKIFSSLFNILPVYIFQMGEETLISSRIKLIQDLTKIELKVDKQFILERLFFNYPLFNRTIWEQIKLLPSCSHIEFDGKIKIIKSLSIEDYYIESPPKGKDVLENISQTFLSTSKKYFPSEKFAVSFTSGFDGRTLVSSGLYFKKDFFTYSFGTRNFSDVMLPSVQAQKLNLEHDSIILDEDYVKNKSFENSLEIIKATEGNTSFNRAHYRYAAKILSNKTKYILTGNFGSELFRAFNYSGSVLSDELRFFFDDNKIEVWIEKIKKSPKWNYLIEGIYNDELKSLTYELSEYKNKYKQLPKNAFFYIYIFQEIFRKYFGAEIVFQRDLIFNRSPYLDFDFINVLLTTYYSGVYSEFYSNNPLKRYKGQLPYCYIIKNSFPPLLDLITGKNYKPKDLLTFFGKLKLLNNFIFKKMKKKEYDPYLVEKAFDNNVPRYLNTQFNDSIFNVKEIKSQLSSNPTLSEKSLLSHILSINMFLNNKYEYEQV